MRRRTKALILVLISLLLVDAGQFLLKWGMTTLQPDFSDGIVSTFAVLFSNAYILIGFMLFATSSIFWLAALSQAQLSYAYPLLGLSYAVVTAFAVLFFHEELSVVRLLGLGIIVGGVALLART